MTSRRGRLAWRSALVNVGIRLTGAKRTFSSAERFRKMVDELPDSQSDQPPRDVARTVTVVRRAEPGMPITDLVPDGPPPVQHVVYLHGGAYVRRIGPYQWRLVRDIALHAPAVVHVPLYGLAPQVTAGRTVPETAAVLVQLMAEAGAENVTLLGDSAGGGLAVAVAQHLRDRDAALPARLVLLAPWLDVTMSDSQHTDIAVRDRMLDIPGLQEAGRMYAGDLDVRDPRVSPLFGDMAGLPPVEVFVGTADVLNPDAHRLVAAYHGAGQPARLHEAPGMQHVYPVLPLLQEARLARVRLVEIVRHST